MTSKQVERYAKLSQLIDKLEKERKTLRDSLVEDLQNGTECPKNTPYLLSLVTSNRTTFAWKEWAQSLAETSDKLKKQLNRWVAEAPETTSYSLRVNPNPAWKGQSTTAGDARYSIDLTHHTR